MSIGEDIAFILDPIGGHMIEDKKDIATDGGHWYTKDGKPAYTHRTKDGREVPNTLRDARKDGLLPSVTTITGMAAKPALVNWMVEQGIMAALTLPRIAGEPDADYLARIKADSKERAKRAAEKGSQIHGWIEQGFQGTLTDAEGKRFYASVVETLKQCGNTLWSAERSFACPTLGYGGKCDLYSYGDVIGGPPMVIDFKTTDKPIDTLKTWDEHAQQLAAYSYGLGIFGAKCGICYVSTITSESRLIWIDDAEIGKGFAMFEALLSYWYAKTGLKK